jgi:Tfp pilus assembly protein PilV
MKGGDTAVQAKGFTIVEVMIVLVVTLAIFASAVGLISGRVAAASFTDEMQQVQSQMQSIVNDVASGYYSDDNSQFTCAPSAYGISISIGNTGSTAVDQATNNDGCTYLGRAVQFTSGDTYYVYSVLGLRQEVNGDLPTGYAEAFPTATDQVASLWTSQSLGNELKAVWGSWSNDAATPIGAGVNSIGTIAFLNDPSATTDGASAAGGTTQLSVIPVSDQTGLLTSPNTSFINDRSTNGFSQKADAETNPINGIGICFASQSTNQSVLFTFGGGSRRATVETHIYDGGSCS